MLSQCIKSQIPDAISAAAVLNNPSMGRNHAKMSDMDPKMWLLFGNAEKKDSRVPQSPGFRANKQAQKPLTCVRPLMRACLALVISMLCMHPSRITRL